jgi:pSer/pThr/pTyr-binding forkhead associated (FHA) protein
MEERKSDPETTGILPVAGRTEPDAGAAPQREQPAWLDEVRDGLSGPGRFLAYEDGARHVVVAISREWTRIGRSMAADVRFDDATVSRRHALVQMGEDGVRVLDDRSLNGIHVNGERVERSLLRDGDQVAIGRHALYFLDTAAVGSPVPAAPATAPE